MSNSPVSTVQAVSTESFIDSLGVNVHMAYTNTPYVNVAAIEGDLAYLGVTTVRDVGWPAGISSLEALAADNIKLDIALPVTNTFSVNLPAFMNLLNTIETAYPGSIKAIEGPNEVNFQPATWDGGTTPGDEIALQQALFAAVGTDLLLQNVPVYALTIGSGNPSDFTPYEGLGAYANYGNAHPYLPDNGAPQGNLEYLLGVQTGIDSPGLPRVITETGWTTDPKFIYNGTDQITQAKLTLDTLMDAYKDGVATTYIYELIDEANDPRDTNSENHYGLFNYNGTPKLAATAIHNLTTILNDPGHNSFAPGTLNFGVTLPNNAQDLLMEKSNGTFDLVLWAEATIWNNGKDVKAHTENVTIHFASSENVSVYDPLDGTVPIASYAHVTAVTVGLTDHPIILGIVA